MIKQCKGKDLDNVSKSKLLERGWLSSIKYDGNYVQIHKQGNSVRFFTSGGKEFYHELVADSLVKNNPNLDFIIETEFIGSSQGKLGDRVKAAKLTTYRTNFEKGLANVGLDTNRDTFIVFDVIILNWTFEGRLAWLLNVFKGSEQVRLASFEYVDKLELAKCKAKELVDLGYEGLFLKHINHVYQPGKRVNEAIKLKYRKTADLLCIDIEPGEGKYIDMIGSLVLQDKEGRTVSVGSGLDDSMRGLPKDCFIDKIVEIEYEQIIDTYIQPTFVRVREDKTMEIA
jgi:ATP-dependent DNA ligase